MGCAVGVPPLLPAGLELRAAGLGAPPLLERVVRNVERLEGRPTEVLLRRFHLVRAQRRAMRLGGVLLMRAAPRDVRPHDDERWPLGHPLRLRDSRIDRLEIVTVGDPLYVPTVRLEAPRGVVG